MVKGEDDQEDKLSGGQASIDQEKDEIFHVSRTNTIVDPGAMMVHLIKNKVKFKNTLKIHYLHSEQ